MKVRVKVTQEHIDRGEPNNMHACPVLFALRDAGIPAECVYTSFFEVDASFSYNFPESVVEEIKGFDYMNLGMGMVPFEFDVDVPERLLQHVR